MRLHTRCVAAALVVGINDSGLIVGYSNASNGASDAFLLANEKVTPNDIVAAPDVLEAARPDHFQVVALEALLRMKLTSFRRKDQVHVQDMLEVGLIDATWKARLTPELAARLQTLLDTPQG